MYLKIKNIIKVNYLLFVLLFIRFSFSDQLISPSDSKINYYGRIDFTDPQNPQYCWSGLIIEASFTGSIIGMKVNHENAYYDLNRTIVTKNWFGYLK